MKKYFNWLRESNRPKHIVVGFLIGLFFGLNCAFVAGTTAEVKVGKGGQLGWLNGNGFDYLDLYATMIGGLIGSAIRYVIMYFIWK